MAYAHNGYYPSDCKVPMTADFHGTEFDGCDIQSTTTLSRRKDSWVNPSIKIY